MAWQSYATVLTMLPNPKGFGTSAIVWSLVWAIVIIATAFLFKGNPAQYWIESGLILRSTHLCGAETQAACLSP
jgi:hypothetical protein